MSFRILHGVDELNIGYMTCNTALAKGIAVEETGDGTEIVQACPCGTPLGFLLQDVTSDGPSYEELELLPGSEIYEVKIGNKVTVIDGEGELVTSQVVTSGTGNLGSASVGDELAIKDGKWRVAQTGDVVCGYLRGTDYNSVSGDYHIRRIKGGYIKA